MDECQKNIINNNIDSLKKMNYYLIIEKLKEKNVITEDEYKKYEDNTPNIKKMLDDIKNKSDSFEKLKESLEEIGQGYLLPDQIKPICTENTKLTYVEKLYQLKKSEKKTRTDETVTKIDVTVQPASEFLIGAASNEVRQYSTRSKNRGVLLIINNNNIQKQSERKGSKEDLKNLCVLFEQLNFKIFSYEDLSKKDMENKINAFKLDKETEKADICVVFVLSHGGYQEDEGNSYILSSDNKKVKTSWICNEFNNKNCPVLLEKPKIILFNACRGSTVTDEDKQTSIYALEVSDMLIGYSTTLGYVSYRNEDYGSWYILAICETFAKYAHKYDVNVLFLIVTEFVINMKEDEFVQTPMFKNHAFGYCYLHPNIYEKNGKKLTFN